MAQGGDLADSVQRTVTAVSPVARYAYLALAAVCIVIGMYGTPLAHGSLRARLLGAYIGLTAGSIIALRAVERKSWPTTLWRSVLGSLGFVVLMWLFRWNVPAT